MKPRKLTADEVTFTVELEPEDIGVRGNVTVSGDDEADRADEDAIIARLERDQLEAWCVVVVKAEWHGYSGRDTLGGCSFDAGEHASGDAVSKQVNETVDYHGMKEQALDDLNARIAAACARLAPYFRSRR